MFAEKIPQFDIGVFSQIEFPYAFPVTEKGKLEGDAADAGGQSRTGQGEATTLAVTAGDKSLGIHFGKFGNDAGKHGRVQIMVAIE